MDRQQNGFSDRSLEHGPPSLNPVPHLGTMPHTIGQGFSEGRRTASYGPETSSRRNSRPRLPIGWVERTVTVSRSVSEGATVISSPLLLQMPRLSPRCGTWAMSPGPAPAMLAAVIHSNAAFKRNKVGYRRSGSPARDGSRAVMDQAGVPDPFIAAPVGP